jgi:Zn-dependent membrane protease YugP
MVTTFATLVGVGLLPAALTAAGLGWCRWDAGRPAPRLPVAAGPWIERRIAALGAGVLVEVVPADAPDAYWPNAGTLAISERTWAGELPRDWAIAAHELGHAQTLARHALLPFLLPLARFVAAMTWRLCLGGLIASALLGEPAARWLALVALVVSVGANAVVCADEIVASRNARATIAADPLATPLALRRATDAMRAAAGAYVLGAVGRLLVLVAWPWVVDALSTDPSTTLRPPSDLGIWLLIAMVPVVLARAGLAVWQVVAPEPVPSELDLFALLARESQWEWVCALGTLALVAALHAAIGGPALAVAVALALAAASGPLQALLVAVTLLPGVVWRRIFGEPPSPRYPRRAREDVPQAMIAMWSDPPCYLRAAWLVPLAYVPLVGLLATRILASF